MYTGGTITFIDELLTRPYSLSSLWRAWFSRNDMYNRVSYDILLFFSALRRYHSKRPNCPASSIQEIISSVKRPIFSCDRMGQFSTLLPK